MMAFDCSFDNYFTISNTEYPKENTTCVHGCTRCFHLAAQGGRSAKLYYCGPSMERTHVAKLNSMGVLIAETLPEADIIILERNYPNDPGLLHASEEITSLATAGVAHPFHWPVELKETLLRDYERHRINAIAQPHLFHQTAGNRWRSKVALSLEWFEDWMDGRFAGADLDWNGHRVSGPPGEPYARQLWEYFLNPFKRADRRQFSDETQFVCSVCGKRYPTLALLILHIEVNTEPLIGLPPHDIDDYNKIEGIHFFEPTDPPPTSDGVDIPRLRPRARGQDYAESNCGDDASSEYQPQEDADVPFAAPPQASCSGSRGGRRGRGRPRGQARVAVPLAPGAKRGRGRPRKTTNRSPPPPDEPPMAGAYPTPSTFASTSAAISAYQPASSPTTPGRSDIPAHLVKALRDKPMLFKLVLAHHNNRPSAPARALCSALGDCDEDLYRQLREFVLGSSSPYPATPNTGIDHGLVVEPPTPADLARGPISVDFSRLERPTNAAAGSSRRGPGWKVTSSPVGPRVATAAPPSPSPPPSSFTFGPTSPAEAWPSTLPPSSPPASPFPSPSPASASRREVGTQVVNLAQVCDETPLLAPASTAPASPGQPASVPQPVEVVAPQPVVTMSEKRRGKQRAVPAETEDSTSDPIPHARVPTSSDVQMEEQPAQVTASAHLTALSTQPQGVEVMSEKRRGKQRAAPPPEDAAVPVSVRSAPIPASNDNQLEGSQAVGILPTHPEPVASPGAKQNGKRPAERTEDNDDNAEIASPPSLMLHPVVEIPLPLPSSVSAVGESLVPPASASTSAVLASTAPATGSSPSASKRKKKRQRAGNEPPPVVSEQVDSDIVTLFSIHGIHLSATLFSGLTFVIFNDPELSQWDAYKYKRVFDGCGGRACFATMADFVAGRVPAQFPVFIAKDVFVLPEGHVLLSRRWLQTSLQQQAILDPPPVRTKKRSGRKSTNIHPYSPDISVFLEEYQAELEQRLARAAAVFPLVPAPHVHSQQPVAPPAVAAAGPSSGSSTSPAAISSAANVPSASSLPVTHVPTAPTVQAGPSSPARATVPPSSSPFRRSPTPHPQDDHFFNPRSFRALAASTPCPSRDVSVLWDDLPDAEAAPRVSPPSSSSPMPVTPQAAEDQDIQMVEEDVKPEIPPAPPVSQHPVSKEGWKKIGDTLFRNITEIV